MVMISLKYIMDADRNLGIRINQRHHHATEDYQYHYLSLRSWQRCWWRHPLSPYTPLPSGWGKKWQKVINWVLLLTLHCSNDTRNFASRIFGWPSRELQQPCGWRSLHSSPSKSVTISNPVLSKLKSFHVAVYQWFWLDTGVGSRNPQIATRAAEVKCIAKVKCFAYTLSGHLVSDDEKPNEKKVISNNSSSEENLLDGRKFLRRRVETVATARRQVVRQYSSILDNSRQWAWNALLA